MNFLEILKNNWQDYKLTLRRYGAKAAIDEFIEDLEIEKIIKEKVEGILRARKIIGIAKGWIGSRVKQYNCGEGLVAVLVGTRIKDMEFMIVDLRTERVYDIDSKFGCDLVYGRYVIFKPVAVKRLKTERGEIIIVSYVIKRLLRKEEFEIWTSSM